MSEPVKVGATQFFEFIGVSGPVVVFLSVHPEHPFNHALLRRLREEQGYEVPFGALALVELIVSPSPVLPFLAQALSSCGVSMPFDVLPGYYLFHDGRMLAWDSGLPTIADAEAIARGSLLGVVAFAFTKDASLLAKAAQIAVNEAIAARLVHRFQQAFEGRGAEGQPRPGPSSEDDVLHAYRTLGVPPDATDHEVNVAWRRLRVELHPDRAAADPVEFERRSRIAAELNRARDTIRKHRARTAR